MSKNRAEAVVNELVNTYNIKRSRLTAEGVSMLSPMSNNDSEEGRKINRRVEIVKN